MRRERERLVTPPAPGDVYVELAEIPVGIGLKEITSFFDVKLIVTQIKLVGEGIAYVQFKDVDMKQEALTYDLRFLSSKFVKGMSGILKALGNTICSGSPMVEIGSIKWLKISLGQMSVPCS